MPGPGSPRVAAVVVLALAAVLAGVLVVRHLLDRALGRSGGG